MELPNDLFSALIRASLCLAAAGLIAFVLLRAFRVQSPWIHRAVWTLVLAQGLLFFRIPMEIAVLEPPAAPPASSIFGGSESGIGLADFAANSAEAAPTAKAQTAQAAAEKPDLRGSILTLWLVGIAAVVSVYFLSYLCLMLGLARARLAPEDWQAEWRRVQENADREKLVPLLVHDRLGPLLCLTPLGYRVVVPRQLWADFTPAQRIAVLEHELAHIERRDVLKSLLTRFLALPHWFNPVSWWAVRQFDDAAEWACDQRLRQPDGGRSKLADYARALLALAEPQKFKLATSFANGATISPRIRRLVQQNHRESWLKRVLFLTLVGLLAGASLFSVKLVAQEDEERRMMMEREGLLPNEEFKKTAAEFAGKLNVSGDMLERFHASLATQPGQIVLRDRAMHMAEHMREELRDNAFEEYVANRFEESGDGLVLKKDEQNWREQLLRSYANVQSDLEALEPKFGEIRERLAGESDAEKLMARFLEKDEAAVVIYMMTLREHIRPGVDVIAEQLGGMFTPNAESNFEIVESRESEWLKLNGRVVTEVQDAVHEEMAAMLEDFAEIDEFHQRFKEAAKSPLFSILLTLEIGEIDPEYPRIPDTDDVVNDLFGKIEEATEDRAEGLVFNNEGREGVGKFLERFELLLQRRERMGPVLTAFGERIEPKDELHREIADFFKSDVGHMFFVFHSEIGSADPAEFVEVALSEVLHEEDGKLRVRDEAQEEITWQMQEFFEVSRELRRRGRKFDALAEKVQDEPLAQVLASAPGQFLISFTVHHDLEKRQFDGFGRWVEEHFDAAEDGKLTLKADAIEAIEEMLIETQEIEAQLKSEF